MLEPLSRSYDEAQLQFVAMVTDYAARFPSEFVRSLQLPAGKEFPWVMVSYKDVVLPSQGWKLHLSASQGSATRLLHTVLPILLARASIFKVISSRAYLQRLNDGLAGLSQIGKCVTIYPLDEQDAVQLAQVLDEALARAGVGGGPAVPSDRALRPGSPVYYRYGGFHSQVVQTLWGDYQMMMESPDHELVVDQRTTVYTPPQWVDDPFVAAGVAQAADLSPLVIDQRYLLLTTLYQSAQSQVQMAVDLVGMRRCIVKRPGLCFVRGNARATQTTQFPEVAEEDDDICARLRHEAAVLRALVAYSFVPTLYACVESGDSGQREQKDDGEVFLVMEDIDGESLQDYVSRVRKTGERLSPTQIVAWGKELTEEVRTLHACGILHRDIKSTNVLVTPEGRLRLIDFGIACFRGERAKWLGAGTPGYMSPEQRRGEVATEGDDIYALGALLFFLASGAEPSLAPRQKALTARPLQLLHAQLPAGLIALIEACLQGLFLSAEELLEAFVRLERSGEMLVLSAGEAKPVEQDGEHYRQLARRLGQSLAHASHEDVGGRGRYWMSTQYQGKGMRALDLHAGDSGSLLALAELVDEFQDEEQRRVLAQGALWLQDASERQREKMLPGLYIGVAGMSLALLRAGQVLGEDRFIKAALERSRWVDAQAFRSPDMFNGTAGRLCFHVWLWAATGEADQLKMALRAGEALLAQGDEEGYWVMPEGYASMSTQAYLGYAHGAAGIADALLTLYEATGQQRFLAAALRTGRWLQRQAIAVLGDKRGLDWPITPGKGPHGAYWCHGATGIGLFFLHLARLSSCRETLITAERAARTVAEGNRASGPVHCHGLAGNIEFLLDIGRDTKDQQYVTAAFELAQLLEAFSQETDGALLWCSESPITVTPDYLVGYAGIAMTLMRLGNPQRPRQLGVDGLRYRAIQSEMNRGGSCESAIYEKGKGNEKS